ncbi:MAG: glycosyltransferase family 2 protein, partial [Acidimicrobiales bacterium]
TLVRADLFAVLGGFDPGIPLLGEDLDLCWRAQVAGARVLVAPSAVARHLEALGHRHDVEQRRRLQARHRLRTVLTCYRPFHLMRVLPQAALLAVVETVYALAAGRLAQAKDVAGAWSWNFKHLAEVRAHRRALRRIRLVPDSEVRRLQVRGSARFGAYLRGQIGRGDDRLRSLATASRDLAGVVRAGRQRVALIAWVLVLLVLLIGARTLVVDGPPAIGDLPRFPDSPWPLFSEWLSGWRTVGLGNEGPAPTGLAMLGVGGVLTFGQMGLLRTLTVVALLPTGVLGAWRLGRGFDSIHVRLVAVVVYASIPVPYNAIATGRWSGLVVWAGAPWLVGRLARATGLAPFDGTHAPIRHQMLGLGLLVAVVGAVTPVVIIAVLVAALGVVAGGVVVRTTGGTRPLLAVAAGAICVAAVLHLPWAIELVAPGRQWASFGGLKGSETLSLAELLRFQSGPLGAGVFGWVFLLPAVLPLLIGRDWRFEWAVRAWGVALASWGAAWVSQQDWWNVPLGAPEVLLAFAAVALAVATALGLVAFEVDLPGYRFGWRQAASVVAAAGVVGGALPVLMALPNGRWRAPAADFSAVLGFLDDEAAEGAFRVLWLGDPDVLPGAGWTLGDGLAYTLSEGGLPTISARWPGSSDGSTGLAGDAVNMAQRRGTSRLGRLLAPMGVRYVVLPARDAPQGGERRTISERLVNALGEQLDLVQEIDLPTLRVFENTAWLPTRSLVAAGVADTLDGPFFAGAAVTDLSTATPVLVDGDGYARWNGEVGAGTVYFGAASSSGWQLEVDGDTAPRAKAFGWANAFAVPDTGQASLRYRTSVLLRLLLLGQVLLWILVVALLRPSRRADRAAASA